MHRPVLLPFAAVLAAACSFDASGVGGPVGGSSESGSLTGPRRPPAEDATATSTDSPAATGESDETGPTTEGLPSSGSSDSGAAEQTDSGEALDCVTPPLVRLSVDAQAAIATPPMLLDVAPAPVQSYAFSEVEGTGIVQFSVEVACPDTYVLWGLVHDAARVPLPQRDDPDSFDVRIDQGSWIRWDYGCQMLFESQRWSFETVAVSGGPFPCASVEPRSFALDEGLHTVTFRNVEAGWHGSESPGLVAAIARLVVTNDTGYIPTPWTD